MEPKLTRRAALVAFGAAGVAAAAPPPPSALERAASDRNDRSVERYLRLQVTDPASPWRGSVPDEFQIHSPYTAGDLIDILTAALVSPQSKFHNDAALVERIGLAAGFLERSQSAEGFIDLLSTNFNSPPDTGFVVHNVATAAAVARRFDAREVLSRLRPFLVKAADGLSVGGIHTPNHRWVVSSALAQVNELFPNAAYVRRIDQWLAEGIDIDSDGQYTERSTVTYNTVVNRALVVMAAKLNRPELLDPVRRNLSAMAYLLHPDGEVVTEVSRRQDQFVRGTMAGYWFSAMYMAAHGGDGSTVTLARQLGPENARLSALLEYPELAGALPEGLALPENYARLFPAIGLARVRRGGWDATVVLANNSRFLSMRGGGAVVEAVRFATSFFGKGQFVPDSGANRGSGYSLSQSLEAPYYQPLSPPERVTPADWSRLRARRRQTQVCRLQQGAFSEEPPNGIDLRIEAAGTAGVPLAIEITLREGGQLVGCQPAPRAPDAWILEQDFATWRTPVGAVRFGPGAAPHRETQLRGAEARLPGTSVYITGYTPFVHTLHFELA